MLETSEGLGRGWAATEFPWAWNIFKNFLINLCKERVILEGINIFGNSISPLRLSLLRLGSYKSQANGHSCGEWTKVSAFPFEIQLHGVTPVYISFTPFELGGGIHSPPGFSLPVSTNINQSTPDFLFLIFTVEKCSDEKMSKVVGSC